MTDIDTWLSIVITPGMSAAERDHVKSMIKQRFQEEIQRATQSGLSSGAKALSNHVATSGETSDGYHTFNELYDHRIALFAALMAATELSCWRSLKHSDGSKLDGWFIAGIDLPTGTITYHLPEKDWDLLTGYCETLAKAPEWDGATPADTVKRLRAWLNEDERIA